MLIIRSQDKKVLVECKRIYIYANQIKNIYSDSVGLEDCDILGTYQSEIRALEVLNNIEITIVNIERGKFLGKEDSDFVWPIYEMPIA